MGRAQPLTSSATSRSRSATRLAYVEWPVTKVQRSFDPSILECQVTAAAVIQACWVTASNQPVAVGHSHDPKYFQSYIPDVMRELFAF